MKESTRFKVPVKCKDSNTEFKEYRGYVLSNETLDGVSKKFVLLDGDSKLIIKLPKEKLGIVIQDHITEFISCKFAEKLNYSVQSVSLGYYYGKECVVIKKFNNKLTTLGGLGDSTMSNLEDNFEYNLDNILSIQKDSKFLINEKEYKEFVWDTFVLDMFLGNFDRHENNWGFFKLDGIYTPAPIFDLGASLYPKFISGGFREYNTDGLLRNLITHKTRSAILYEGKKKNYFEMFELYKDNKELELSLTKLINKLDNFYYEDILEQVCRYNGNYSDYVDFLRGVIKMKVYLFKTLLGGV